MLIEESRLTPMGNIASSPEIGTSQTALKKQDLLDPNLHQPRAFPPKPPDIPLQSGRL